jgi:EAL domain-containing protein (putative c-di-GMP-specific phosphodiesterase class I)
MNCPSTSVNEVSRPPKRARTLDAQRRPRQTQKRNCLSLCIECLSLRNGNILFGAETQKALYASVQKRVTKALQNAVHKLLDQQDRGQKTGPSIQCQTAWLEGRLQLSFSASQNSLSEGLAQDLIKSIASELQKPFKVPGQTFMLECLPRVGYCLGRDFAFEKAAFALESTSAYNPIQQYRESSRKALVSRLQRETEIREGLKRGEFVSYFQPKIDPRNNDIVGGEALVRWKHPTKGLLMPKDFIGIAEQSSLICDISHTVAKQTVTLLARLKQRAKAVPIAINVSEQDLKTPSLIYELNNQLTKHELSPTLINLEVSERVASLNEDDLSDFMHAVQKAGFRLSLDDFGTAYSGLLRLLQLPISEIKVDRLFLVKAAASEQGRHMLHNLIGMLLEQNYQVTVEGVEKRRELKLLQTLPGCFAQGFYFSPAVEARKFQDLSWAC